jgi:mRNA interferase MazF
MGFVAKVRPALVLSVPSQDDERVITSVVPHTTSVRGTRYEIASDVRWLMTGAFDAQGVSTYPTVKLTRRLGRLPDETLASVEKAVLAWLGLPEPSKPVG